MGPKDPSRPGMVRCVNPATGHVLGYVPVDTPDSINEKIDRARLAQKRWATTSFADRRKVISVMAKAVHKHRDLLCKLSAAETGKTREPLRDRRAPGPRPSPAPRLPPTPLPGSPPPLVAQSSTAHLARSSSRSRRRSGSAWRARRRSSPSGAPPGP